MPDIEKHLHQLSHLVREQDSIKLVVRLESSNTLKTRYLAVVSCLEEHSEEFCLLGIDCDQSISLGLVLAIFSYTTIRLDGDGGFCVTSSSGDGLRSHIFKPVSVQTMWSALQSLYRASECAKENNCYQASAVRFYEHVFNTHRSDPSCLNEWNILPGVESRRPFNSAFTTEEISFQEKISCTLREILLAEKDLDEVTSKEIRTKLEYRLQVDLSNYKSFIDEEMLKILGQMEAPALILDNLYLGTEWNASHQQDLFDKNINYILNVTAEIDNFFPDTFRYMNIPICDTEETDILRYFSDSYKFINKARKDGKNVLVHCKMGISRSATIVIAYVMKSRNWELSRSLRHVKERRSCVKPNPNFMKQLEIYEGILTAKKFSSTLEKRSKSESNLKQSEKTMLLSANNDRVIMCSSNGDITDGGNNAKSHKKYFNTAPARLKPEKNGRRLADILKPKSSSCAAILSEKNELHDIVPHDVMSSFEAAVSSLEQPPVTTNPYFEATHEFPFVTTCNNKNIPLVTVTPEPESSSLVPMEIKENIENSMGSRELGICNAFEFETTSPLPPSDSTMEVPPECCSPDESKKIIMSLKCCRRPYNGHTFSVSPNQVVNLSSVMDYSKFSVRHLVNEFELQSKAGGSGSSSESTNTPEILSHKSPHRTKVRSKLLDHCDNDYTSSEENENMNMVRPPIEIAPLIPTITIPAKSSKKGEKLGCLPFFRKSSTSSKNSNKTSPMPPSSPMKKGGGHKKGKILETVAKLSSEGVEGPLTTPMDSPKYQSTGVVKQRLEAFEAKAVPDSKQQNSQQQLFFRSHMRSHSAAGGSSSNSPMQYNSFSHLSQRKSSMPQLGSRSSEFESSSPPFSTSRLPIFPPSDHKTSLASESNGIFKSFPCPMVRGFKTSGSKSFFSTSPNTTSRVQHGSTHPLNLLPRAATLTQSQ